jgi:hypothetical protein
MVNEMDDKTYEMLQQLAEKFGTTVEYLWPAMVAHARWEAVGEF